MEFLRANKEKEYWMTNSIYIATTEPYTGKSVVALGITELLLRHTSRVGIFRPVIGDWKPGERDKTIDLLLRHFNLPIDYDDTHAFHRTAAARLISQGGTDEFMDHIITKFKALEAQCDFVLCIGSDFEGEGTAFEFDLNADIARNLGAPVLVVSSAAGRDVATVVNSVHATEEAFAARGCQLLGTIVNRVNPERTEHLRVALSVLPQEKEILSVIPENTLLSAPTLAEVGDHLHAKVLMGGRHLDRLAERNLVIAMTLEHYLEYLCPNVLLITPGDRHDVIVSAVQAHHSKNYPQVAGIVLTGGIEPAAAVMRLVEGLSDTVPIMLAEEDTYSVAVKLRSVRSYITPESPAKIQISLDLFEDWVDTDKLIRLVSTAEAPGMTPKMFIHNLIRQAQSNRQHIVLPEGNDERILRAADVLMARNVVDLTILGNPAEVRALASRMGLRLDFDRVPVFEPQDSPKFEEYAQTLSDLRKHKGMSLELALDMMTDVSYFGTMMVYKGDADGMVSGAAHTTMHTIRPALQFVKTKPGFSVVSSVFFMCLPDRVRVYGDCAVNPNPTAEELAEIAISSADTAQAFGIEPRVAMLSYSTGESGQGEDVERVREATRIAQERRPELLLEGPMQYDAAVDPSTAALKMPGSKVAGRATVFIFPDLNTGNNTYKAVQRETGAIAIGPVLQGLKKPVNDLSRGCTVDDIINTVTITAIQAQNE